MRRRRRRCEAAAAVRFLAAGTRALQLYLNTFLYLDSAAVRPSEPVHDLIYTLKYFL